MVRPPEIHSHVQRISVSKLADIELEIQLQKQYDKNNLNNSSEQNKQLSTPPLVASEPNLVSGKK